MASPYDVLGVDADADDTEVERAYRRRVKEAHPDRGGSVEEFRRVRGAYEAILAGEASPPLEAADGDAPSADAATPEGPTAGGDADAPGSRAPGGAGGDGRDDDADPATRTPGGSRIEYLNYEVLSDHGWSIDDPDLFEKAAAADLHPDDYGKFLAESGETLLEAAENRGYAWPYACRGGACANCAVAVVEGELDATVDNILSEEMVDDGFRLSCIGRPVTGDMRVVYNVKHLPGLDDLRLPADRFERARADD
ncbi:2Fe-2S iron-sulfur cluster-binding protein (plasmid) [Halobaculum sp. CBA1158]|uniref:ferredoxin Fer n=1 Tax=Halobaculum sp. CBA1158 TaxID=2904243 RepID=UPI001F3F20BE|nr:ferredoxin Fer [Halobaculum sp. CBA1158]UIP01333.1 2Fe-2S iron-sulfur cluster-binding protein [Halobaculum sp. CBA1158]